MHKPLYALGLASLLVLLFPTGIAAQTVLAEDFESPDTPNYATYTPGNPMITATNTWEVTQNSVDLYEAAARPEAGAYDGGQAVDLTGSPGEGIMETSFATVPGAQYEIVFHYARNAYVDPGTASAVVELIGNALRYQGGFAHSLPMAFSQYVEYRANFTADSAQTILRFTSLTSGVAGITVDGISISHTSTIGINPDEGLGDRIRLAAHPNPFSRAVTLEYEIRQPGMVEARVHDTRGRLVRVLVREEAGTGTHFASWSGIDGAGNPTPAGIYFLVLKTSEGSVSRRVLLLR